MLSCYICTPPPLSPGDRLCSFVKNSFYHERNMFIANSDGSTEILNKMNTWNYPQDLTDVTSDETFLRLGHYKIF